MFKLKNFILYRPYFVSSTPLKNTHIIKKKSKIMIIKAPKNFKVGKSVLNIQRYNTKKTININSEFYTLTSLVNAVPITKSNYSLKIYKGFLTKSYITNSITIL